MTDSTPQKSRRKLVAVPSRDSAAGRKAAGVTGGPAARSPAGRRLLRSALLGSVALGAAVWYGADMFGVNRDDLLGYLGVSALLVGLLVLAAALLTGLLRLLRR